MWFTRFSQTEVTVQPRTWPKSGPGSGTKFGSVRRHRSRQRSLPFPRRGRSSDPRRTAQGAAVTSGPAVSEKPRNRARHAFFEPIRKRNKRSKTKRYKTKTKQKQNKNETKKNKTKQNKNKTRQDKTKTKQNKSKTKTKQKQKKTKTKQKRNKTNKTKNITD